jgi:RsiW-degrading membrane proteinase PrsW (M82 family)
MDGQRSEVGGLWSHARYTGLVGAGIGYFPTRTDRSNAQRTRGLAVLIAAAWFLYFVWDSPFVNGTSVSAFMFIAKFVIYPRIFVFAIRWVSGQRREDLGVILASDVWSDVMSA